VIERHVSQLRQVIKHYCDLNNPTIVFIHTEFIVVPGFIDFGDAAKIVGVLNYIVSDFPDYRREVFVWNKQYDGCFGVAPR
jgi:hypothetical protein